MTRSGRTRRATHQPGRRFSTMRRRGDKHVMIAVFLSYLVFGLMIFAGLRHFQTTNDARQDRISQENDKARDKFSLDQCLRQRNLEREHNRLIDATNRGWQAAMERRGTTGKVKLSRCR